MSRLICGFYSLIGWFGKFIPQLLLRLLVAWHFWDSGLAKFNHQIQSVPEQNTMPFALAGDASFSVIMWVELACAIMILIGFSTRIAALILAILLAGTFMSYLPLEFNSLIDLWHTIDTQIPMFKYNLALMFILITLFFIGAGGISADGVFRLGSCKTKKQKKAQKKAKEERQNAARIEKDAKHAEEEAMKANSKAREAEKHAIASEERSIELEKKLKNVEDHISDAEHAEAEAMSANSKAREAEKHAIASEEKSKELEKKLKKVEDHISNAESAEKKAMKAKSKVKQAEKQAKAFEEKSKELEKKLKKIEDRNSKIAKAEKDGKDDYIF